MSRKPVDSPCIQFCQLNDAGSMCSGCGRTTDEIGSWMTLSPEERSQIMSDLPKRLKATAGKASPDSTK